MRITISGLPGSGTSTVSKIISKKMNYPYIYAGNIFRQMAADSGKSLLDFNKLAGSEKTIDFQLDNKMLDYAKNNEDILLEGRIIGFIAARNHIPAFKIWIDAPINIRAERVAKRDKQTLEAAISDVKKREEMEVVRYLEYYNIDMKDLSVYDLTVDSSVKTPNEIVSFILEKIKN